MSHVTDATAGSQQEPARAESVICCVSTIVALKTYPHIDATSPKRAARAKQRRWFGGTCPPGRIVSLRHVRGLAALVRWTPVTVPNTAIAEIVAGR